MSEPEKKDHDGGGQGLIVNTFIVLTPDPGTWDMFIVEDNKFAFVPGHLSKLLNPKSLDAFCALGGLPGLEKGLRTDIKSGLSMDETVLDGKIDFHKIVPEDIPQFGTAGDCIPKSVAKAGIYIPPPPEPNPTGAFADRQRVFRDNRLPEKKQMSLLKIVWRAYNDRVLILLTIAAVVSLALGLYQTFGTKHEPGEPKVEWVEGVAIIVAIVIVVLVGSLNDWNMQRQFSRLNKRQGEQMVNVVRSGRSQKISVFDVMVGDVMHLNTGDIVPVDGIFIDGNEVRCDESSATGESDLLRKTPAAKVLAAVQSAKSEEDVEKLDPFILSGSRVSEGHGTFLVTAVGVNSTYGRITTELQKEQEPTPLQNKLNTLADWIAKIGSASALLLFLVLFIKFCVQLPSNHASPSEKGQEFLNIFIVSVTIIVVAVPEGLPLAVTLALSFATVKMLRDNNLVRVLRSCETMGNATTICSDKTGTLTQNKMTVVNAIVGRNLSFVESELPSTSERAEGDNSEFQTRSIAELAFSISSDVRDLLLASNLLNSTAFEGTQDGKDTFIGSKTEVALLTLCRDFLGGCPAQELRSSADVVQVVPFDSNNKYSAVVIKLSNGSFRAFVKGASEILVDRCTNIVEVRSQAGIFANPILMADRERLDATIDSYAKSSLRTIGSSYRDFKSWPPEDAKSDKDPRLADFDKVHRSMTLIAIYGIKDPLRPTVVGAIDDCRRAGIVARMVTGDNIKTAKAIAAECGIYKPDEGGIAMEGPDFRRLPKDELRQTVQKLQVLARSSPDDKRILVQVLKDLGETVAVTGDGTNDAPALKLADIGFSMGIAGTDVAKEASSIILLDDNFSSIVKGIMWGRAVNDSIRKFLQFQLTVNVTAVVLTFVSAIASSEEKPVLNAVQLLWINLIMDTFAALALATDAPARSILDRKPDRKSAPLITPRMAKMIIGQGICQLAITLVLHFAGRSLLGYGHTAHDAKRLSTLVFNTFVWLQLFNELNNRRLDNKLNIFEDIHKNFFFIITNLIMVGGQVLIIFVGDEAFKITPLNGKEWGLSIGLGAISIPWGALIRLVPDAWLSGCVPNFISRKWAPKEAAPNADDGGDGEDDDFAQIPLRTMSSLRGPRVQQQVGFQATMQRLKVSAKRKMNVTTTTTTTTTKKTREARVEEQEF
ncbi:Calcium-transporting ATPase 2 [Escovopsis weberi]|uniref:Calcium-transporting ATPase n=1 Tax=Escovopsis weberi TaxID=150374 RepID=A0A0M9VUP6_ESCWE|nr:Calcium-transporting ATPase 2 [Escovopsis weberi]